MGVYPGDMPITDTKEQQEMHGDKPSFEIAWGGSFFGVLRWPDLDRLWVEVLGAGSWYLYTLTEPPPQHPADGKALESFLSCLDQQLRPGQNSEYCGFVFVDSREDTTLIKVFNPSELGCSAGRCNEAPRLPTWVLSRSQPVDLTPAVEPPGFWSRLLRRAS